jgi:WD40 repeat protein
MDYAGSTAIWSTKQCSQLSQVSLGGAGRYGAISFDLTKTALTEEGFPEVFVTDLLTRKIERLALKQTDFLLSLEFHPVDHWIALGTRDGLIHLWQPAGNKILRTLRGHRGEVTSVAFDNRGEKLASGTLKGEVILWDLTATHPMEPTSLLPQPGVASVSFLADGQRLMSATRDGKAALWHLPTAKPLPVIPSWPAAVKTVALSPDGRRVAAQTGKSIMIRATQDGAVLDDIPIAAGSETPLVFSADGRHLAFADAGKAFLWSLERHAKINAGLAAKQAVAIAFAPVGQKLAFTSSDNVVTFFDWQSGRSAQLTVPAHSSYIRSLALSGDGKLLATGGGMYDGNISLWDSSDGRLLRTLQPNDPTDVTRLFFSPDSRTLASITAFSDQLRLWDVASGRLITAPIRVGDSLDSAPAAFSPDGALLATVEKDSIVLRDLNPASWIKAACQTVNRNLTPAEWKDYIGASDYEPQCPQFTTPK